MTIKFSQISLINTDSLSVKICANLSAWADLLETNFK